MLIFLYGDDTFRSRQKLKELKEKFRREVDTGGHSLAEIDGESSTAERIRSAINTPSLFARRRMIVVERLFSNKSKNAFEGLREYLETVSARKGADESIIIFWDDAADDKLKKNKLYAFLAGQRYSQNFKTLSNAETAEWVRKEAEARGGKIKQKAAQYLTGLMGNDLWQLSGELDKLLSFRQGRARRLVTEAGGAEIDENDVAEMSRGNYNENIFALTDAIGGKNKALALKLLEQEIGAGATENYLLHMIIRQFRIMLQVRQALDSGHGSRKIASELKLHPFVAQKCQSQVRSFSLEILKKIFRYLVEIDRGIKTGRVDAVTALDLLIAKI